MSDVMLNEKPQWPVPWRIVEYVDVAARARDLGCRIPSGIALLPGNFATAASAADFVFSEVAARVRLAWRSSGLIDTGPYRMGSRIRGCRDSSDGMSYPSHPGIPESSSLTVFFGSDLFRVPSRPVLHAIGIVATVLLDDPGSADAREARFSAVVERPNGHGYLCLQYDGDACELVALAKSVRAIWEGDATQQLPATRNAIGPNSANGRLVRSPAINDRQPGTAKVLVTK
jgi:hypothetical protein